MRTAALALFLCSLLLAGPMVPSALASSADIVLIFNATSSMGDEIGELRANFGWFAGELSTWAVDTRYSVVLFGGEPELVLDFTADASAAQAALNSISTTGAVAGFQNDHSGETLEAGLEAVRLALGTAAGGALNHDHVGGSGVLSFRPGARTVVILVTDEDSDWPYFAANRLAGQTTQEPPTFVFGTAWQLEVDGTAQDLIATDAFFFPVVNPGDLPTPHQYGDPYSLVANPDFTGIDYTATLANLTAQGYDGSLQGQLLNTGLISVAFDVSLLSNVGVPQGLYSAVALELSEQPVPVRATTWGRLKQTYQ